MGLAGSAVAADAFDNGITPFGKPHDVADV
jgi:hypothetical protein